MIYIYRSLALRQQVVSQAPQHFRSSETQTTCDSCFFPTSLYARSFSFAPTCPGQFIQRSFGSLVFSNMDTRQSGISIAFFTFFLVLYNERTAACSHSRRETFPANAVYRRGVFWKSCSRLEVFARRGSDSRRCQHLQVSLRRIPPGKM